MTRRANTIFVAVLALLSSSITPSFAHAVPLTLLRLPIRQARVVNPLLLKPVNFFGPHSPLIASRNGRYVENLAIAKAQAASARQTSLLFKTYLKAHDFTNPKTILAFQGKNAAASAATSFSGSSSLLEKEKLEVLGRALPTAHILSASDSVTHTEIASIERTELANINKAEALRVDLAPLSHAGIALNLLHYPQEEHDKLLRIAGLLGAAAKHEKLGNTKTVDQAGEAARSLLFSLSKDTIRQVTRDEQFLRLHLLKFAFGFGE